MALAPAVASTASESSLEIVPACPNRCMRHPFAYTYRSVVGRGSIDFGFSTLRARPDAAPIDARCAENMLNRGLNLCPRAMTRVAIVAGASDIHADARIACWLRAIAFHLTSVSLIILVPGREPIIRRLLLREQHRQACHYVPFSSGIPDKLGADQRDEHDGQCQSRRQLTFLHGSRRLKKWKLCAVRH